MDIELLYFEGCPHVPDTERLLGEVLAQLAPGAVLRRTRVDTEQDAADHDFLGSPSVRVDGLDLEQRVAADPVMACRVYEGGGGVPPRWLVEAHVLRALAPQHVLFLCVANSARSQLAEGIARALAPPGVRVSSAGSAPTRVRPEAVDVLAEEGIDITTHRSTAVAQVEPGSVDLVVTLCAEEVCPAFLGDALRVHWGLPDPAAIEGDPERRREAFRATRDELRRRLSVLFGVG